VEHLNVKSTINGCFYNPLSFMTRLLLHRDNKEESLWPFCCDCLWCSVVCPGGSTSVCGSSSNSFASFTLCLVVLLLFVVICSCSSAAYVCFNLCGCFASFCGRRVFASLLHPFGITVHLTVVLQLISAPLLLCCHSNSSGQKGDELQPW